jgi:alpha-N-arabinofuranosidase
VRSNTGKVLCLLTAAFGLNLSAFAQSVSPVDLTIHVDHIKAHSSPLLYGLMTEEINYSYDGGLYPELIRNRSVHPNDSWRSAIDSWSLVEREGSKASFAPDKTTGPSAALPYSLKLTIENASPAAPAGIANAGYWGIPVRPATTYKGSFFAKSDFNIFALSP